MNITYGVEEIPLQKLG